VPRSATPAGYQTPWRRKCCLAYSATCPRSTPSSGHGFSGDVRQGGKAFRRLGEFYREHADIIERNRILTLDFHTGEPTQRRYSRAKVIDMIFFIEGGGSSRAI
jgi:hypothetical protein